MKKKTNNMRRMRNTLLIVIASCLILFSLFIVMTFSKIYRQVEEITSVAVGAYQLGAIESLTHLIQSGDHSFEEKNSAIWALGQFADEQALPFLEALSAQTEEKSRCRRSHELCKYEIEKAIKWCKHGNWTSWMYKNINK